MEDFTRLPIAELLYPKTFTCSCGKTHSTDLRYIHIGEDALQSLPNLLGKCGISNPFVVSDKHTECACGEQVRNVLAAHHIKNTRYIFPQKNIEADEFSLGQIVTAWNPECDGIIAIGSGTINDLCKMVAKITGKPSIVIATAPSMDGFASSSSSMIVNGIKTSISSICPVAILADLDILCQAPIRMLQAGLGDMMAKYISICEWRISNIITGEYYCDAVAAMAKASLEQCVAAAPQLLSRDPYAVRVVVEGLILAGIAVSFAGLSRPASGIEHYISHVWDMRALEKHQFPDLHGIQVGVGTMMSLSLYDFLKAVQPDREKALKSVKQFDMVHWEQEMHRIFGCAADGMIAIEHQCGKHDDTKHAHRLERILSRWSELLAIMKEELPTYERAKDILKSVDAPITIGDLSIPISEAKDALWAGMEIRDKYVATRLLWDLGLLDEGILHVLNS